MTTAKPSIGHVCPNCINAVFWAHREALERVFDLAYTPAENEDAKRRAMADAAFECLSFFDLYYDGCLHYKTGTLKDHEVWLDTSSDLTALNKRQAKEGVERLRADLKAHGKLKGDGIPK